MDNQQLLFHLEDLVDTHGLHVILSTLQDLCRLKADHLRTNWQDEVQAKTWDRNAQLIGKII